MGESTATLALVIKAKDLASGQVGKLNKSLSSLKSGALSGLPLGFMGAAGAAAVLTSELAKGLQGAIDEQAGIAKLTSVLKANAAGWDGNMDAVEAAIKPRIDLGFADDELRASLAKLVPATKNVNRALELQTTAMDLARLKGVSLEEASQALVDIEGGRYKALGKLIGSTKEITTETEALAAVQAVAAGQAAAYMETTAGKIQALQVRWDELTETVAGAALPAIDDFTVALTNLGPVLDGLTGKGQATEEQTLQLADAVASFNILGAVTKPLIADVNAKLQTQAERTNAAAAGWDTFSEGSAGARENLTKLNPKLDRTEDLLWGITGSAEAAAAKLEVVGMQAGIFGNNASSREQNKNPTGVVRRKRKKKTKAAGGWVGLYGPEDITVGERGPEYITPNHAAGSPGRAGTGGVMIQGVSERELMDMVDRQLYFRLRRAGTAV